MINNFNIWIKSKMRKQQKGAALIIVLVAISLLSTFIISYQLITKTDLQIVSNLQNSEKAFYISEAGIEQAIMTLRSNHTWDAGFTDYEFPIDSENYFTVSVQNNYPNIVLFSEGLTNGFTRQIELGLTISGPPEETPYPIEISYWKEL
jgi:hypothetical protein